MKIKNALLKNHTWFKIGGPANILTPENESELIDLLTYCHRNEKDFKILGNGSNLLVTDQKITDLIIHCIDACTDLEIDGTEINVGASIMMPQFVNYCLNAGLGGYEYLFSVPGTIGGGIYMNAGRGKNFDLTISDYLINVKVFSEGEVIFIEKTDLEFKHRWSSFHNHDDWVILSAKFDLPRRSRDEGVKLIKQRMDYVEKRERKNPNAGSVFKHKSRFPIHILPLNFVCGKNAWFTSSNRITHDGRGDFTDINCLIKWANWFHRLTPPFKKPVLEYEIWD